MTAEEARFISPAVLEPSQIFLPHVSCLTLHSSCKVRNQGKAKRSSVASITLVSRLLVVASAAMTNTNRYISRQCVYVYPDSII